jgi:hypothetical protein
MFCKECGNEVPEKSGFCPKCGAHIQTLGEGLLDSAKEGAQEAEEVPENKDQKFRLRNTIEDEENSSEEILESEESEKKEDEEEKTSHFWFFFNSALFCYNSYAIVNNFCIGDGYWFIAFGLIVNIAILLVYSSEFEDLFPKLNKNISYGILGIALFIGIMLGYTSYTAVIEETATEIVTEIIQTQYNLPGITCKAVTIDREVSDGFYKGTAILDNGGELRIVIEEKGNMIYVTIPDQ